MVDAKLIELSHSDVRVDAINLIGDVVDRFANLAQLRGQIFIARSQPGTGIEQEKYRVGLFHSLMGLLGHGRVDPLLFAADTSSINDDKASIGEARLSVLAVAGQAGQVGHQGIATARQSIEQRRLADIGTPHQGDHWNHIRRTLLAIVSPQTYGGKSSTQG